MTVVSALLMTAAFIFTDPAGDAHGDGSYVLPAKPAYVADSLDLREFTADEQGGEMVFTVSYGVVSNPWNLKSGFSSGVTDIFVQTGLGGNHQLANTGFTVSGSSGWQYHLRISGASSSLEQFTDANAPLQKLNSPEVTLKGTSLEIKSDIPAGKYSYWVTSSLYSPLSQGGVVKPSTDNSPLGLYAPVQNAPTPLDILAAQNNSAYSSKTLDSVGNSSPFKTILLAGLGILGLIVAAAATVISMRSND